IYNAANFAAVEVLKSTDDMQRAPNPPLAGERLLRFNRLLLEDVFRNEISRSLDRGFVVKVVTPGPEWRLVRVDKVEPVKQNEKFFYGTEFSVVLSGGNLVIKEPWRGTEYGVGRGNFPLWESGLLRATAFRTLFKDWQDGSENFPDLGDPTSPDPNS